MRITTLAEYGVICALHLARRTTEGPVTGRDVAARERLPVDYVEQILLRLRRAGIVTSTRGARGGYALANGSDDNLGLYNTFYTSSVRETSPGYWQKC